MHDSAGREKEKKKKEPIFPFTLVVQKQIYIHTGREGQLMGAGGEHVLLPLQHQQTLVPQPRRLRAWATPTGCPGFGQRGGMVCRTAGPAAGPCNVRCRNSSDTRLVAWNRLHTATGIVQACSTDCSNVSSLRAVTCLECHRLHAGAPRCGATNRVGAHAPALRDAAGMAGRPDAFPRSVLVYCSDQCSMRS